MTRVPQLLIRDAGSNRAASKIVQQLQVGIDLRVGKQQLPWVEDVYDVP